MTSGRFAGLDKRPAFRCLFMKTYERLALLDHPEMIQTASASVSQGMQPATSFRHPPAMVPIAPLWRWPKAANRDGEPSPAMDAEDDIVPDRTEWARLIVAVATHQNRAAFSRLFEYFAPRVKTYMQRSGATEASADELAQETMLTVWRKAGLFDPASAGASAWIFAIARNLRIDAFRRERRGGAIALAEIEAEFQIDETPRPDALLAAAQSDMLVRSALAELSADQMRVIELSFFEEKAHAEIAKVLEIPLGTVKSRLRLAMNRLRNLLGEPS
jgi:RNA polymerase sigma-70 factor, ECF subfamily